MKTQKHIKMYRIGIKKSTPKRIVLRNIVFVFLVELLKYITWITANLDEGKTPAFFQLKYIQ